MDEEEVEPLVHVFGGPEHADPILAHLGMEAFVPDVADAVHCEFGLALAEQDGLDLDPALARLLVRRRVPGELLPPKVVDEPARRQHVERAEGTLGSGPLRVVVVPVDAEDGERDVVVDVFVVDGRETMVAAPQRSVSAVRPLACRTESSDMKWRHDTHPYPDCSPTPTSLTTCRAMGLSPMQYSRMRAIVWCKLPLLGLFS